MSSEDVSKKHSNQHSTMGLHVVKANENQSKRVSQGAFNSQSNINPSKGDTEP
jgi:hypothetical protein